MSFGLDHPDPEGQVKFSIVPDASCPTSGLLALAESREGKAPRMPLGLWSELVRKKTVLGTKNWASKEERIPCQSLRNRYPWQQMEVWKQRGQRLLRRQRV